MTIPDNVGYAIAGGLVTIVLAMVGLLHKDMKGAIVKLADLITPLQRLVDRHDMKLDEHAKKHDKHETEISELKKNTHELHTRIVKIEDKI